METQVIQLNYGQITANFFKAIIGSMINGEYTKIILQVKYHQKKANCEYHFEYKGKNEIRFIFCNGVESYGTMLNFDESEKSFDRKEFKYIKNVITESMISDLYYEYLN